MRRFTIMLISILFLASLTTSCRAEKTSTTLSFTGDIMMHYAVKGCAKRHAPQGKDQYTVEGFSYLFAKVSPLISSADFAVGNMEFPVSPPFIQNEFIFNCPPEVIPALVAAGFDAVSIANNHLLDQGNRGFFDTIGFLEKYKLPYFGAARDEATARKGLLVEKNGIRVRILSYTGLMNYAVPKNGPFAINLLEEREKLMQDIAAARKDCDILIVQPHWGVEYTLTPTEEQRALYRAMIDAGADLVIGHHPHVLQYIEGVKSSDGRSCAIFYSLGNFICNQNYTFPVAGSPEKLDIRDTIAVILSLTKEGSTVGWSAKIEPLFTVHDIRSGKGGSYKDIRTIVLNDEIAALRKNLVAKPKEKDATQKLIDFYLRRTAVIRKVIFKKGDVPGVTYQEQ